VSENVFPFTQRLTTAAPALNGLTRLPRLG